MGKFKGCLSQEFRLVTTQAELIRLRSPGMAMVADISATAGHYFIDFV